MASEKNFILKTYERTLKSSFFFWLMFVLILIAGDQLTKHFSFNGDFAEWLERLRPIFGKQNFKNYDFVFSLRLNASLMYLVYGMLVAWIVHHVVGYRKSFNLLEWGAWLLILTGAGLNLFERIVLGYVRDFIYFFGAIFNLADFYILLGVVILLLVESNRQIRQHIRQAVR